MPDPVRELADLRAWLATALRPTRAEPGPAGLTVLAVPSDRELIEKFGASGPWPTLQAGLTDRLRGAVLFRRDSGVGRFNSAGAVDAVHVGRHHGQVDQRWVELARTLRRLGLWRHLSNAEADQAEREAAEKQWPFVGFGDEPDGHWFSSDGEEMAEGFVRRELEDLAPRLRELGVDLHVEDVTRPTYVEDGPHIVSINGRRCVVWSPLDWAEHRAWRTAAVRPLGVINELLAEAGAIERLFTLYAGGNDGVIWLLDPRVVEAIAASGLKPEHEVPALATADAL